MNNQAMALLSQGFSAHQQGKLIEAERYYQQVLAIERRNFDTLYLLGVLKLQVGDIKNAIQLLSEVVRHKPQHIEGHLHLGIALAHGGQLDTAMESFNVAQKLDGKNPVVYFNKGLTLASSGCYQDALDQFELAIAIDPVYLDAINNQGNVYCQLGDHEKALHCFNRVLQHAPDYLNALMGSAIALCKVKRFEAALVHLDRLFTMAPDAAEVHDNRGIALAGLQRFEEAIEEYQRAIQLDPVGTGAFTNLGVAYAALRQFDLAFASYEKALELSPNDAAIYTNLGAAYADLRQFDQALAAYKNALRLNPESSETYNNLGKVYMEQQDFVRAREAYEKALVLDPTCPDPYINLGLVYANQRQFDQAFAFYQQALQIDPNNTNAKLNQSFGLLALGDYQTGWRAYESRNDLRRRPRVFSKPLWLGQEDISNATILVHAEQGLGDTLQFCRYVDLLAQRCRQVFLLVQKPLARICQTLASKPIVLTDDDALPEFDVHCPLMSLPLAFGTTVATIPASVPYLHSDSEKVAYWRSKLESCSGLRVGLVWNGGFRPDQPELWGLNARRNIPLAKLQGLSIPRVEFFSLQKGKEAEAELHELHKNGWDRPNIVDYVSELVDYTDTAALIENLDLVISVDTSVVHLAGALGKPVWILNRYDSCWRWFVDKTDSPWYPTAKIYNQPAMGDWDSVIVKVAADLEALALRSAGA